MRLRNVAVAVAIILPAVALGGSALADGDGPFKKIPISFTAGPPLPGAVPGGELTTDCTSGGACVAGFNFGTGGTVVGDFAGDYVEVFAFGTPAGGGRSVVTGTGGFTGTVKRCGTGSFVWTEFGVARADGSFEGTQTIFPGSGTGDLVGITGSWKQSSTSANLSGSVRCKVDD